MQSIIRDFSHILLTILHFRIIVTKLLIVDFSLWRHVDSPQSTGETCYSKRDENLMTPMKKSSISLNLPSLITDFEKILAFATILPHFGGIYQTGISAGVIFQRGRKVRVEQGGKWEWGQLRMGGMKEEVQSIWEVAVCNWMSGRIYCKGSGESLPNIF